MNSESLQVIGTAMSADLARMAAISRNLVNAATPGYRREMAFTAVLAAQAGEAGDPVPVTVADQRHGALQATGRMLDLAIDGEGFFEVHTPDGAAYTRRGDFRLDERGGLATVQGHALQGLGGPLQVSGDGSIEIDTAGNVLQAGQRLGQVKVVLFEPGTPLSRGPGGLFVAAAQPQAAAAGSYRMRQGTLESSNVETGAEMVRLLETLRHFEAAQKVVQGVDEMTERALRKLGEF
jgi:flagellar basal-body rod protein FlgF